MEINGQESPNSQINLQIFSQASNDLLNISPDAQIYTDLKGPFFSAPKNVKDFLLRNKLPNNVFKCYDLNLDELYFDPIPTQNHLCMRYFQRDVDKYYHCYECTGDLWGVERVVFCESCFVLQNHIGHHYYQETATRRDDYCDCGSQHKTKRSMICPQHNQNRNIKVEIKQGDRQYFISTFRSLLEIACYLQNNTDLMEKVSEKLAKLCHYSAYYSKLSLQLLKMESFYIPKTYSQNLKNKYFIGIMASNCDINKILFQICGNNQQNLQLARFMLQNYNKITTNSSGYQLIDQNIYKLICDYKTMNKLANQGFFCKDTYFIYQEFSQVDKQHFDFINEERNLYLRFLRHLFKTQPKKNLQKFLGYGIKEKDVTNSQIAWQLLRQIIEIYPFKKKGGRAFTYRSSSQGNKKNVKKNKKANQEIFKQQNISDSIRSIHIIIMRCVAIITEGNWESMLNFREKFAEHKICLKGFENILVEIAYFANSYIFGNQSPETPAFATILLTTLFQKSQKSSQLIDHMWLALLGKSQNIQTASANLFQIISSVLYYKTHLPIMQGALKKIKKTQFQSKEQESRQIEMKKFFTKFLHLRGIIQRQQLIDLRNNNLLQFNQVGKILRTLCTYNQDDQAFICNSVITDPQFEDKFALALNETNIGTMSSNMYANTNIYFGFEKQIMLQQNLRQLLYFVCNSEVLVSLLDDIWKIKTRSPSEDVKNGYLYLFSLVMLNGFINSENKQLHNRLLNLKTGATSLKQYLKNKTQIQIIQRLFRKQRQYQKNKKNNQINGSQIMEEKDENKQNKSSTQDIRQMQRKRRFEEKRKKIHQKYHKKQESVLQGIRSKTIDGSLFSDEDVCLTCHQKTHPNNQLVYLGRISVGSSLCQAMHGSQQKANTSIFTCFHTVHLKCFIELHQGNRTRHQFTCPLCSQLVNCFLMRSYNPKNSQLNNIFKNIIISTLLMNYKCYNTSDQFILFFKHLLQSKGLGSLVDSTQNWQKHKVTDKSDYFIQNLAIKFYDQSHEKQKQSYIFEIDKLIQNIKQCKKQSCKYVQLAVAQSLKAKIKQGPNAQLDSQLLVNIRKCIKYQQYLIIKQQIQKLLNQKIEVPQLQNQPSQQSKQSLTFSLKQLPRDSLKFNQFLKDKSCYKNHNGKIDFYCLICGEGVCQECNDQEYILQHGGISAYLSIEDFIVHLKNPAIDEEREVYFNDFRIAYHQKEDYNMEEQVYRLDVIELSAFIQQFLRQ